MKIRPLHDRVLVRRQDEEETSAGGILLPTTAQEKPNQGVVIAVGKGKVLDNGVVLPIDVKVGDIVIFGKYAGSDTVPLGEYDYGDTVEGKELIIISESDIKAVIESA